MTERSYFDSQSDDTAGQPSRYQDGFACSRRMVDLTHTLDTVPEQVGDADAHHDWPVHPEILELLETLLEANPTMLPGKEAHGCERPHAVYLPENYEPAYAYPLVVWFHDDGGSEADLRRVMPQISNRNYIGVALRGNSSLEKGHGWSLDETGVTSLVDDVRAVAVSLRREYHIHSERIYLAGFGSGATAAVEVMLRQPEWFGGVLSLNGGLPKIDQPLESLPELKDKRILIATSVNSPITKIGDVVAAGRLLYAAGMQVGTRVYQDSGHRPSKKMLRDIDSWLMDDICAGTGTAGLSA